MKTKKKALRVKSAVKAGEAPSKDKVSEFEITTYAEIFDLRSLG
jgi:hypothetical protein